MTDQEQHEHVEGTPDKRDATDLGVPMNAGKGPQGPEDALDPNSRGDYSGRVSERPSYTTELIPEDERVPGGPIMRTVRQG